MDLAIGLQDVAADLHDVADLGVRNLARPRATRSAVELATRVTRRSTVMTRLSPTAPKNAGRHDRHDQRKLNGGDTAPVAAAFLTVALMRVVSRNEAATTHWLSMPPDCCASLQVGSVAGFRAEGQHGRLHEQGAVFQIA